MPTSVQLPAGWKVRECLADACPHCAGTGRRAASWSLTSPTGQNWPLIGNRSAAQRAEMIRAIVAAHSEPDA